MTEPKNVNLHAWMRRSPEPAKLRLDGKTIVPIGDTKTKWRDAVEVCESREPSLIEAMGADDSVLRVTQRHYEGVDPAVDAERKARVDRGSELAQLGQLIAEAADRAAERHEMAYRFGFETLAALVESVVQRNNAVESAFLALQSRVAQSSGDGDGDPAQAAVVNMFTKAMANDKGAKK
jgi:hypothetical protein